MMLVFKQFRFFSILRDKKMFSTDDIFNYDKSKSDPSGPGPASYYVPRRPPQEKISPSYTFGRRCLVEKSSFYKKKRKKIEILILF